MKDEKTPKNQREFIDYRFTELDKKVTDIQNTLKSFTFVKQIEFDEFRREVKETYVTKESFDPVKRVVYGMVGLILVAVVGAVIGATLK